MEGGYCTLYSFTEMFISYLQKGAELIKPLNILSDYILGLFFFFFNTCYLETKQHDLYSLNRVAGKQ